jgi:hypothetical protein
LDNKFNLTFLILSTFLDKNLLCKKQIYFNFRVNFMNLELIGQLVSVALVVGAGPIIIGALFVRGGNL